MGNIVACLATEAVCCCTSATCRCFGKAVRSSTATRIAYALIFLVNTLVAWILLTDVVSDKLSSLTYGYLNLHCKDGGCYGVLAVQRMCFSITIFHLLMACSQVGVETSVEPRGQFQNGWWGPKVGAWILLAVVSFFIPNEFFMFWGNYIALFGAMLFILLQIILLIDFTHNFSDRLLEKFEMEGNRLYQGILVGSAISLLLLALVMTGLMYFLFGGWECNLNRFFITFNLVLSFAIIVFSIAPQVQEANVRSGLMQPSIIVAYATYLILSAVANEPESKCNPIFAHQGTQTFTVLVGTFFTFVAITYSTSTAAVKARNFMGEDAAEETPLVSEQPRRRAALLAAVEEGALPRGAIAEFDADQARLAEDNNDEEDGCAYNYTFFHIIFALAGMYVAMLLTNWNIVSAADGGQEFVQIGKSWAAVWVKVVSSWIVALLYSWTLWAPVMFPDREWVATTVE